MEVGMRGASSRALVGGLLTLVSVGCGGGGGPPPAGAPVPTLATVSPTQGPVAGGTAIALTGTGFTGTSQVTFGGVAATNLNVADTAITCTTPAGAAGVVAVVVTTPGGSASLPTGFRYRVVPDLTNASPATGATTGGLLVTLTGSGFLGGVTSVTFGGAPATGVNVQNDATCTCVTPVHAAGTVDVTVTTPGGSATLLSFFEYTFSGNPLTLTKVSPDSGFAPGGGAVTLTGTGFTTGSPGTNTVTFDGVAATAVVAVNDTTITCTTPAGSSGPANVAVTNTKGTQTLNAGFTYFTFPPTFRATNARLDDSTHATVGPDLDGEGAYRYAVYTDTPNAGNRDIYFNRSTDGGATWLATDVRLDTDATPEQYTSYAPKVCCSGQYVHVVWADYRNNQMLSRGDIYYNRSTDYGATWLANDVRLDTDVAGAADSWAPQMACVGSHVYVTWPDWRNASNSRDIYFQHSADNGATWLATDVKLDSSTAGQSRDPQIACTGQNVYVAWYDSRNDGNDINSDVYFNRSTNNGGTWLATDVRLDTNTAGAADSGNVRIACATTNVCVVWQDMRNGASDIYLNHSADSGATWLGTDVRINTPPTNTRFAQNPSIAMDGSKVYVGWNEERTTVDKHDVYMNRSTDGGATWLANDFRVSTDTIGTVKHQNVRVGASGGVCFVVWEDFRTTVNREDIYYNVSLDGGVTWAATDTRLNDDTIGTYIHDLADVWNDGANLLVGWMDARDHLISPLSIYVTCTVP
jgi:hypothetical protein